MPCDGVTSGRSANEIAVDRLHVWYHLPFAIYDMPEDLGEWRQSTDTEASESQLNYFHSYVSNALWSRADRGAQRSPAIEHWQQDSLRGQRFEAQKRSEEPEEDISTFCGTVQRVELRMFRPDGPVSRFDPAMAILVVGVEIDSVSTDLAPTPKVIEPNSCRGLTLADAQSALDWTRRAFARFPPASSMQTDAYVAGDMIEHLRVFEEGRTPRWKSVTGQFQHAPWLKCLIKPWRFDGQSAEMFGDERAFMTSGILLASDDPKRDEVSRKVVNGIKEQDLFRLAEADKAGEIPPYGMDFVRERLNGYQYMRHAPAKDGASGNASLTLIAHHHLCMLGAGSFFDQHILGSGGQSGASSGYIGTYYRHLQFLAIFEYFRLVMFSQRLTRLVRQRKQARRARGPKGWRRILRDTNPAEKDTFRKDLQKLRQDFLEFTHVHHFSNVSLQLQPREIYAQLYQTMGLAEHYRDIEDELRSANEFVEAQEMQEAADRAERLNRLLSLGVPLSLIVGAMGANLFIGDAYPVAGGADRADEGLTWSTQLRHLAMIVMPVAALWGALLGMMGGLYRHWIPWLMVALFSCLWLYFGV